jgi:hypothetical protein
MKTEELAKKLAADFDRTSREIITQLEAVSDYDGQAHMFASRHIWSALRETGFKKVQLNTIHRLLCEMFNPEWNPYREEGDES